MNRARILLVFLLLAPLRLGAQSDCCSWSALDIRHSFPSTKLSAGLYTELRYRIPEPDELSYDMLYFRPKLSYMPVKWLTLTMQMDFAFYENKQKLRYIPQCTLSFPFERFGFSFRERVMMTDNLQGDISTLFRSKCMLKYSFSDLPVSSFIAVEPFYSFKQGVSLNRTRWYMGVKAHVSSLLGLSIQYVRQQFESVEKSNEDILFLTLDINI